MELWGVFGVGDECDGVDWGVDGVRRVFRGVVGGERRRGEEVCE